jgi:hypothetical protein
MDKGEGLPMMRLSIVTIALVCLLSASRANATCSVEQQTGMFHHGTPATDFDAQHVPNGPAWFAKNLQLAYQAAMYKIMTGAIAPGKTTTHFTIHTYNAPSPPISLTVCDTVDEFAGYVHVPQNATTFKAGKYDNYQVAYWYCQQRGSVGYGVRKEALTQSPEWIICNPAQVFRSRALYTQKEAIINNPPNPHKNPNIHVEGCMFTDDKTYYFKAGMIDKVQEGRHSQ